MTRMEYAMVLLQQWRTDIGAWWINSIFYQRPRLCAVIILGAFLSGTAGWAIGHYWPRSMVTPVPLVSPPPRIGGKAERTAKTRFEQRHRQARRRTVEKTQEPKPCHKIEECE